jgi:hypothetical protein
MTSAICMTGWRGGAGKSNAAGGCRRLRAWRCSIGLWSVRRGDGRWQLAGGTGMGLDQRLPRLPGRPGYSPQTVRAYAFRPAGVRRVAGRRAARPGRGVRRCGAALPGVLPAALLPGRAGGNVYSIRDGRNVGYAPATINRRLAAVSGLFGYQAMRDPAAPSPIPRRAEARRAAAGERSGLLAHLARPKRRSGLRVREPRRLPRGLDRASPPRCWRASAPIRKGVPDH